MGQGLFKVIENGAVW